MAKRAPTRRGSHPSRGAAALGTGNTTTPRKDHPMLDISTLAVKETATIDLETATGEPLLDSNGEQLSITVYGPGSKQFQKAQATRNRAILEYVRKGGKKMKDDEQRTLDAEFLAACTASFNGFGYREMTGYEMFKAAYLDPGIGFISEQINKAVGDWANFTQGSSKI
jgi:hypothetical protein